MAKTAERNEQMCWCISRFALRYEYRDDKDKKGVLQYTRQYVAAGADPESRHFMDQLDELKEKKNWLHLEGTLNELIRRAANDVYNFRGLLMHQHRPADISRIARWLRTDEKNAKKDLAALQDCGLIEYVPLDEKLGEKNTSNPPPLPEIPENSGKGGKKPANRKTGTKSESEQKSNEFKKTENKVKPIPDNSNKESLGSLPDKQNNADTRDPNQRPLESNTSPQASEATAEPDKPEHPTLSDALGDGSKAKASPSPPDSASDILEKKAEELAVECLKRKYGESCYAFAAEVFKNIFNRLPVATDTADNSEIGCFAMAWTQAENAGLGLPMSQILWDRSIQEAADQRKKKRARNQRAVWRTVFKGLLQGARAGNLELKNKDFG